MPLIAPVLRLGHQLEYGSWRIVDAVTDRSLTSGTSYASAANKLTGPVFDQIGIFPDLASSSIQDSANEAIHRFIS
jgi:hypothetical protein